MRARHRPPASARPILPAFARVRAHPQAVSTRGASRRRSTRARPRRDRRPEHCCVASTFDGPHERRRREHAVLRVDVRPVFQQHPHRVRVTAHRGAMERRDVVLVSRVRRRSRTPASFPAPRRCRFRPGDGASGGAPGAAPFGGTDGPPASLPRAARSARAHAATKRSSAESSFFAPCASSHAAMSALPCSSASVCGVLPSARRLETSPPCCTSRSTIDTSHRRAATCSGASPSTPQARLASAPCSSSQRGPAGLSAHVIMWTSGGTPPECRSR